MKIKDEDGIWAPKWSPLEGDRFARFEGWWLETPRLKSAPKT